MDASIFRMYDIRGVADEQLTQETAHGVARALGTRIRRAGGTRVGLARDVRHSSAGLAEAVGKGFAECGLHVSDLGRVPTPVLYHALHRLDLDGGLMVTGSHNPPKDNGLKICLGKASLYGDGITSLRDEALAGDFEDGEGTVEVVDYIPGYEKEILERFSFPSRPHLAVDCGNGVVGPIVAPIFERLGLSVHGLYMEPDGDFPNHIPDPEVPRYMEALGKAVVQGDAVCGFGFDGDGDRVGVFDENGRKISADWLLALFARDVLKEHPGGKVRYDVKCSSFLGDDIASHGGEPVMGVTGHSLLKRDVKALDAVLGGELSGHIVFNREYLPIDDALYCALRFLEILERSGGPASKLFEGFPELESTAEIKLPCPDDRKFDVVDALVKSLGQDHEVITIDGARVVLEDGAWFLVRASNTTPVLTVRFEARTREDLLAARDLLEKALAAHDEVDATRLRTEVEE